MQTKRWEGVTGGVDAERDQSSCVFALGLIYSPLITLKTQEMAIMGHVLGWAWWHMIAILALGRWRLIRSLRPA